MAYSEGDAFFGIFTILAQISDLHPPATHPQPRNPSRDTHSTPHRCNNLARPRVRRWDFSSVIAHATHMGGAIATRSTPMTYCVFLFESQCTYVSCCTRYILRRSSLPTTPSRYINCPYSITKISMYIMLQCSLISFSVKSRVFGQDARLSCITRPRNCRIIRRIHGRFPRGT